MYIRLSKIIANDETVTARFSQFLVCETQKQK